MYTTIRVFAYLAELAGPTIEVQLPSAVSAKGIINAVEVAYPQFRGNLDHVRVAIDQAFIGSETYQLASVHEIALIPPVSGG